MKEKITQANLEEIAFKINNGIEVTSDEVNAFYSWYSTQIQKPDYELTEEYEGKLNALKQMMFIRIEDTIHRKRPPKKNITLQKLLVAASLICVTTLAIFIYKKNNIPVNSEAIAKTRIDALPGTNKAILTLSNGTRINLTDGKVGEVTVMQNTRMTKLDNGKVKFEILSTEQPGLSEQFSTIETPAGGEYEVILSDGSEVTLNAASSLRFPSKFLDKERRVTLTGEAYFDIKHNPMRPFRVVTEKQTVQVLGTRFNVNSYSDESSNITTLEQGSVRVESGENYRIIKPGQQTIVSENSIKIQEADLAEALAWKNGAIQFKDADIPAIMRQISRWYDVKIKYDGAVTGVFNGGISRSSRLSVLLKILDAANIHCRLEQDATGSKTLIVSP